jgi:signal transduction histidine kinase
LAALVRLCAAHFDGLARERSITFRLEVPDRVTAQIDSDKVSRILLNLLSNAFKFTPASGIVRCTLARMENAVRIEVADSGPGFHPDQRNAIFERFRQAEGGATRRFGGTGLGLAIAKDFVALHRGTIQVSDAPEGGALFMAELPLEAPPGTTVAPSRRDAQDAGIVRQMVEELQTRVEAMAPTTQSGERPHVLVVEDNPPDARPRIARARGDGSQTRARNGHRLTARGAGTSGAGRAKSSFLGLVSHELRTPITALQLADSPDKQASSLGRQRITFSAKYTLPAERPRGPIGGTDDAFVDDLLANGRALHDPLWRMPLHDAYRASLDSDIADLNNISGGPYGGAITAALFLQAFLSSQTRWAHIDTMGWNLDSKPGRPAGGEALALRALAATLEQRNRG